MIRPKARKRLVTKQTFVFFLTGAVLWMVGSFIIALACFDATLSAEQIARNKELANRVMVTWASITGRTAGIWAISGGILGVVICALFMNRPGDEFRPLVPGPLPRFAGVRRPETMAEIKAGFQGTALGLIIGVCGAVFIPPMIQDLEFLKVRSLYVRAIIGTIESLIVTVPILPLSLKILSRARRRQAGL